MPPDQPATVEPFDVIAVERVRGDRALERMTDLADDVPVQAVFGEVDWRVPDRVERLRRVDSEEPLVRRVAIET